jgi:hypothetical protein
VKSEYDSAEPNHIGLIARCDSSAWRSPQRNAQSSAILDIDASYRSLRLLGSAYYMPAYCKPACDNPAWRSAGCYQRLRTSLAAVLDLKVLISNFFLNDGCPFRPA